MMPGRFQSQAPAASVPRRHGRADGPASSPAVRIGSAGRLALDGAGSQWPSAWSRSSIRSAGSSRPTERRSRSSAMPSARALRGAEALVRGGRGMGDQRLGVAQIVRDRDQAQPVEHGERARLAAAGAQRHDAAAAAHLPAARARPADGSAGRGRRTSRDARMRLEKARHGQRAAVVLLRRADRGSPDPSAAPRR